MIGELRCNKVLLTEWISHEVLGFDYSYRFPVQYTNTIRVKFPPANYSWLPGQSGRVVIDDNGDLEPDWALWYYSPDADEVIKYMEFAIGVNNTHVSISGKVIFLQSILPSQIARIIT